MIVEQQQSPITPSARMSAYVLRWCRYIVRGLLNLAVLVAFTWAVAGAIWLFYNGYPWLVAGTTLALFMLVACCDGGSLRERIILSLSVPFLALGGYFGFQIYWAMFTFTWFRAVFNSKDIGMLGLIVFVSGFAALTAIAAGWLMDRLSSPLRPSGDAGKNAEPCGEREPPMTREWKS
jgi:hypothetical protein